MSIPTPVIDPTKNVLDALNAAVKRIDDLREQESAHVRELMTIITRANERTANEMAGLTARIATQEQIQSSTLGAMRGQEGVQNAFRGKMALAAAGALALLSALSWLIRLAPLAPLVTK